MANPLVSAKVPVAASPIHKFNLPSQHLTTANIMRFVPVFNREIIPDSHGSIKLKTFMRAVPMDKPCLGSFGVHNRYFFVPYRTVWDTFSDYITDTPHNTSSGTKLIDKVPRIMNNDLITVLTDPSYSITTPSGQPYDFKVSNQGYTLKPLGRDFMKVLNSLGYKVVYGVTNKVERSALPFLCWVKCFIDWYYPSAYAHYGLWAFIDGIFQRHDTYVLSVQEIDVLFRACRFVAYDNDFFTSLWDNPIGPGGATGSSNFVITDISVSNSLQTRVIQDSNATPVVEGYDSSVPQGKDMNYFSQYIDSSLKALTNYVKRHQLAGARGSLDRYLAQYGVLLDADKLHRCYYLGEDSFPFEIGDVMSTADTARDGGASLGAYAGKGFGYTDGRSIDFESKEFGQLIVINTIVPDVAYTQGVDKNVNHIYKLDFPTGEFDALGASVCTQEELCVDIDGDSGFNTSIDTSIFGFGSRYYEAKIPYSRFTGDFVLNSINADLNGWSTMRLFDPADYPNAVGFVHNLDFVLGMDADQYNRVFLGYSSDDPVDPFYIVHRVNLNCYCPLKPLYDFSDFEDEDDKKKVTLEPNGVRMN